MSLGSPINFDTVYFDQLNEMAYEQWLASQHCQGKEDCKGPTVSTLNMGDGFSTMITSTCNNQCRDCMRQHMPGAWIESTEDPPDMSATHTG